MLLLSLLLSTATPDCDSYVGQTVTTHAFDDVVGSLPEIEPQGAYESTSEYEARLDGAAAQVSRPTIIRRGATTSGLSYDADDQTLTVYETAFGATQINFSDIFGRPHRSRSNFASAVGFLVNAEVTEQEQYEATNGFGARFAVERTNRRISAVWERAGERGESPVGSRSRTGSIAEINMPPDQARDIIERGHTALLISPTAPFIAHGTSTIAATFRRPRERIDTIDVVVADIQCAFILDSSDVVVQAFEVR